MQGLKFEKLYADSWSQFKLVRAYYLSNHPHAPKTRRDRKPENATEKVNKLQFFG